MVPENIIMLFLKVYTSYKQLAVVEDLSNNLNPAHFNFILYSLQLNHKRYGVVYQSEGAPSSLTTGPQLLKTKFKDIS